MPILRFGWLWSKQSFDTDTSFWQLLLPVAKLSNFHLTVYQTRWQAFIAKGSSTWIAWSQNADWPAAHHSKCKECKSCLECRLTLCCCVTCWIKIPMTGVVTTGNKVYSCSPTCYMYPKRSLQHRKHTEQWLQTSYNMYDTCCICNNGSTYHIYI